jgi:hypothetical protein
MYLEQAASFRHYETQRTAATTILSSISAALIALTGALWAMNGDLRPSALPITLTLLLTAGTGTVLVTKLFERSRVNHSLAEAYLNSANALMAPDVGELFEGRVHNIAYVANAHRDYVASAAKNKPYEIFFPRGKKDGGILEDDVFAERIANHNPVDPREIVVPIHNVSVVFLWMYVAKWASWRLWPIVFLLLFFLALYLTWQAAF